MALDSLVHPVTDQRNTHAAGDVRVGGLVMDEKQRALFMQLFLLVSEVANDAGVSAETAEHIAKAMQAFLRDFPAASNQAAGVEPQ